MSQRFALTTTQQTPFSTAQPLAADHNAGSLVVAAPPKEPLLTRLKPAWVDTFRQSAHAEGLANVAGVAGKGAALAAGPVLMASGTKLLHIPYDMVTACYLTAGSAGAAVSAYGCYRWDTYKKIGDPHPTRSAVRDALLYVIGPAVGVAWLVDHWVGSGIPLVAGGVAALVGIATQDQIDRVQRKRAGVARPDFPL